MIAVSASSFEKSGCINCGCDFCYGGNVSGLGELRASILSQLIDENNGIITETQVRNAIDMKIDFANYWKYKAKHQVYNGLNINFMHDIAINPKTITKDQRDAAYKKTWQNSNTLDQFEIWGAYQQIELELAKGNVENAVALANHLIVLYGDYFNYRIIDQRPKDKEYITNLRGYFHDALVKSVNIHYEDINHPEKIIDGKPTEAHWMTSANVKFADGNQLLADWQRLVSMIFDVIDLDVIRLATDWKTEKPAELLEKEQKTFNKYPNLYAMFSLFGLCVYVSKELEEYHDANAVVAIKHVADQMDSPLFQQLLAQTRNNDIHSLTIQAVYCEIAKMAAKYYKEQEVVKPEGTANKLNKKSEF